MSKYYILFYNNKPLHCPEYPYLISVYTANEAKTQLNLNPQSVIPLQHKHIKLIKRNKHPILKHLILRGINSSPDIITFYTNLHSLQSLK